MRNEDIKTSSVARINIWRNSLSYLKMAIGEKVISFFFIDLLTRILSKKQKKSENINHHKIYITLIKIITVFLSIWFFKKFDYNLFSYILILICSELLAHRQLFKSFWVEFFWFLCEMVFGELLFCLILNKILLIQALCSDQKR